MQCLDEALACWRISKAADSNDDCELKANGN